MATFVCRYGTPGGIIRTERREAADAQALRRELEHEGCCVLGVSAATSIRLPRLALPASLPRRVALKEILLFAQEFHALVRAGLPIVHALDALVRRTASRRLREALGAVRDDVSGGMSLSEAAARHPRVFSRLLVASVEAGERSGALAECLARYVALVKRVLAVRKRVLGALTYPAVLVVLSGAVVLFLLAYVVPIFSRMYASFDAALPTATLVLVQVTDALWRLALPLAAGGGAAGYAVARWARSPAGRRRLDGLLLALPVAGEVARRYAASLFCRTLATLLGGGLPIVPSLATAARAVPNRALGERLEGAIPAVAAGGGLGAALARGGMLPPSAVEMVAIGEAAGALPEMLGHVADFLDEELDMRLQSLTAVLEPLVMVAVGAFVGMIVVIMYLPIFELSGQIK